MKLTKFAKYGGCAAKVRPSDLLDLLTIFPAVHDPKLIAGIHAYDDAGIYQINDDQALIFNVDYITPVVDDPVSYGEIAVANSLSDIYAKGAEPLLAMNVMGYDSTQLPAAVVKKILEGGLNTCTEARTLVIGGHTLESPQCFFGLACLGLCHPSAVILNATARIGDRLIMTKPLGTGVIATVMTKFGEDVGELGELATTVMRQLNRQAAAIMRRYRTSAAVDITGFGFIGHLLEMLENSRVGARINHHALPMIAGAAELAGRAFNFCSIERNQYHYEPKVEYLGDIPDGQKKLLYDSQTSGGLLFAVHPEDAGAVMAELRAASVMGAAEIGSIEPYRDGARVLLDSCLN